VKRIASIVIGLLGLACLAGCSTRTDTLAQVGNTAITRADFDQAALKSGAPYVALGDTGRALLLDDLVKRQLLIEAAKQRGDYRDSVFVAFTSSIHDQVARGALLEAFAPNAQVSEAEARALYDRQKVEARLRVIMVADGRVAAAARAELDRGVDFALVAARFNAPGQIPAGGDIGWVQAGSLVRALDPAVTDTPIGQVVGPVEQPFVGWFVIRVEERRTAERPPYEQVRDRAIESVRQRKRSALAQRAAQRMKLAYQIHVVPEGAAFMSERLKPKTEDLLRSNTPPDPNLTEDEKRTVLATWTGGQYTLGDAWTRIQGGEVAGPNLWVLPQVERWIESQVFERVLRAEAETRQVAEEPRNARAIRERQDNYLVEQFYNREIAQHIALTEADLRAEYALRAGRMSSLEAADIRMAVVVDSAKAIAVLDHGAHAGGLAQALAMAQAGSDAQNFSVTYPSQSPMWQMLQPRLAAMRPGELTGPFQVPGGWLLIEMVRTRFGAASFEALTPGALDQLRASAIDRLREARFTEVTDSLRRTIRVTIRRDRIARIPWPPAGVAPALGSGG